jgi:protein SCO1
MKRAGRSVVATVLMAVLGIGALWHSTDGFAAFTAEAARRAEILRSPRLLPAAVLEDQDGRTFSLQDYRGKLLAVEFIYTRCSTICRSLGMAFKQIRDHVPQAMLGSDFALLSISFDPTRDDSSSLKAYGDAHGADSRHWRIARVRNAADLQQLLDAFGVVVIPDGLGGFEHNAAIHLLDRNGRLGLISDIDEPVLFADRIAQWP